MSYNGGKIVALRIVFCRFAVQSGQRIKIVAVRFGTNLRAKTDQMRRTAPIQSQSLSGSPAYRYDFFGGSDPAITWA